MKKYFIICLLLLSTPIVFAQNVIFPRQEQRCLDIKQSCSFNPNAKCIKTYCGQSYNQYLLDQFVQQNMIIGKKFINPLEIEEYFKTNLPKDVNWFPLRTIEQGLILGDFESKRITIIITNNNIILSVKIG